MCGGDLGVAGSPGFGLEAELEVPDHQGGVGGGDGGLQGVQEGGLAGAGGDDDLVVRMAVAVDQ